MDDSSQNIPNEIRHLVSTTKPQIFRFKTLIENKPVVVCLGNSKSGKSTLVNYIQGNDLEAFEDAKRTYIKAKTSRYTGPVISHGSVSYTKLPSVWEMDESDAVIVDMPGFEDNRGIAHDIVNTLYFNQLKHARSISFVLVSDINDVDTDNIRGFTNAITKIQAIISDFNELKDAVSVVFTKDCKNYKREDIAALLMKKIVNVPEMQVKKDLVYHLAKNVRQIGIFKMPLREGMVMREEVDVNVIGAIDGNHPVIINTTSIKFAPSQQSHHTLLEVYQQFIFEMDFLGEIRKLVRRFDGYFNIDKYVFASTEDELGRTKTQLQFTLPRITTEEIRNFSNLTEVKESLLSIAGFLHADFNSKLNFLTFMNEWSLLDDSIKQIVIIKYKQALSSVENQVNKLIAKIDKEMDDRTTETIQYIASQVASDKTKLVLMGTGLIPVAKKALVAIGVPIPESFTIEIVQFSATGCGLAGAGAIGLAAGGYGVLYYKTIRLRQKLRREQGR